ncbi:MAG: hypothetical protein WCF04_05575 [Candidatus Nanopelagicales bacterium]
MSARCRVRRSGPVVRGVGAAAGDDGEHGGLQVVGQGFGGFVAGVAGVTRGQLNGTDAAAVSMMTGLSAGELDDLGGVPR